jgi:hypothetical protein
MKRHAARECTETGGERRAAGQSPRRSRRPREGDSQISVPAQVGRAQPITSMKLPNGTTSMCRSSSARTRQARACLVGADAIVGEGQPGGRDDAPHRQALETFERPGCVSGSPGLLVAPAEYRQARGTSFDRRGLLVRRQRLGPSAADGLGPPEQLISDPRLRVQPDHLARDVPGSTPRSCPIRRRSCALPLNAKHEVRPGRRDDAEPQPPQRVGAGRLRRDSRTGWPPLSVAGTARRPRGAAARA